MPPPPATPRQVLDRWLLARSPAAPANPAPSPRRPLVMGILNITPDSFSDAGRALDPNAALALARQLAADGADLLDLGAESTRPGSHPVPPDTQIARLRPILTLLRDHNFPLPLTIDTTSAPVAEMAIDLGAAGINDISAGLADPHMLPLIAHTGVAAILMHMQGTPATMQLNPTYTNVVEEVTTFLRARLAAATAAGIASHRLIADPGLGFGKTLEHNLALLHHLRALVTSLSPRGNGGGGAGGGGTPILIGASRKGFLSKLAGHPPTATPADRLAATTAITTWSVTQGAAILRVHDAAPARDAINVAHALSTGRPPPL